MTYRLKASIDATRQVPGGEYTVRTPLNGTGPDAALSSGVIGFAAGAASGASYGIPFGEVESPRCFVLRNGEQDLNVRLNGATSPVRLVAGGVLMVSQEESATSDALTSASVSLVTTQTEAGSLTFAIVAGQDPVDPTELYVGDAIFSAQLRASIDGYGRAQVSVPTLTSPAVRYASLQGFGTQVGTMHGVCVIDDGTRIAVTAEGDGQSNFFESFWVIPAGASNVLGPGQATRVLSGDVFGVTSGARSAAQFDDGMLLLASTTRLAMCTVDQLKANDFVNDPVTVWQMSVTAHYDCLIEPGPGHRVWMRNFNQIMLYDLDAQPGGGLITPIKHGQGSNFGVFGGFMAWGVNQEMLLVREMNTHVDIAIYEQAVLQALTSTATNPAPSRILTSTYFPQDSYASGISYYAIDTDSDGNAWVGGYRFDSLGRIDAIRFSAAAIAAAGAQVPDRVIIRPSGPSFESIRVAPGRALYRR